MTAVRVFAPELLVPNASYLLIVGDEEPYAEAEKLFRKHYKTRVIDRMEILDETVINLWAQ